MCSKSLFQIQRFFCCCSLKTGCYIIGYLGLLGNVLQMAGGSAQLQYIQSRFPSMCITNNNYTCTTAVTEFAAFYTQYMAMAIAYHAVSIFFHVALVWGLHKNKAEFILPWLIVKGFECVIVYMAGIVSTIVFIFSPGMNAIALCLLITVFAFCSWLVTYLFTCVFSYYHELKTKFIPHEEKDLPPMYITSFIDDKKQNISEVTINQGAI